MGSTGCHKDELGAFGKTKAFGIISAKMDAQQCNVHIPCLKITGQLDLKTCIDLVVSEL